VLDAQFGLDQGFEFYDDDISDAELPSKFSYAQRPAEAVTDAAIAWLDGIGDDAPYFLWAHYYDPHNPYEAPGYDPATVSLRAPYDLEISYADAQLDRLLTRVEELSRSENRGTLVVFAADHGEGLWEHGEPTHGLFVYNDTLHVPLLVSLPSAEQRGVVIDTPVSLVDLFPSILHWLDVPLPHPVHGVPLPTATPQDAQPAGAESRPLYIESQVPYQHYGWSPLEGVIIGQEKYIAAPQPEFYDLSEDPDESNNLFAEDDPRVQRLARALENLKQTELDAPLADNSTPLLDAEDARRLEALGYMGAFVPPSESASLADPKERVALHRAVLDALLKMENGDLRGGLEVLQSTLVADPDNPRVLLLLMDLLDEPEVGAEVEEALERRMAAPLQSPFDQRIPLYLGKARFTEERWQEAEQLFAIALEADPAASDANFAMARLRLSQGRRKEALLHLDQVVRSGFGEPDNGVRLARLFEETGERARALEVYEALLEQRPDDAIALNNSAWLYYELERDSEVALTRSRRAVSLNPEQPEYRHTHGSILLRMGRASEALSQLAEAVALAPDYAAAYHQLGIAELKIGGLDNAATAFAKAVELAGNPPPAWLPDARSQLGRLRGPQSGVSEGKDESVAHYPDS